jgi:hypothetical protein
MVPPQLMALVKNLEEVPFVSQIPFWDQLLSFNKEVLLLEEDLRAPLVQTKIKISARKQARFRTRV